MKNMKILFIAYLVIVITLLSCNPRHTDLIREYIPDDKELYKTIIALDKEYFDAYNNCDLEKQASINVF